MRKKVLISIAILILLTAINISITLLMRDSHAPVSAGFEIQINTTNKTCIITGSGTCADSDIIIPDQIFGYKVIAIGDTAFSAEQQIKSVTIPDTVESIGTSAFDQCTELTEITLSGSDTLIGHGAFSYCTKLQTVYCHKNSPADEYFASDTISKIYFDGNENDDFRYILHSDSKSATITKYIGKGGNVTIPSKVMGHSVTKIKAEAFSNCKDLTGVIIPSSVKSIEALTFEGCIGLKSVTIDGSLTKIGEDAFSQCYNVTSLYVKDIESWLKTELVSLTSSPLFNGEGCLYVGNSLATEITVPEKVTSIGDYALVGCNGVKSIKIHDKVSSIGYMSFFKCYDLEAINIPEGITKIEDKTFKYCHNLSSITLPSTLISIGCDAFNDCTCLVDIYIPDNVKKIGARTFYGCWKLEQIDFPDGIKSIEDEMFANCINLQTFTFYDSVNSIGYGVFSGCQKISSIVVIGGQGNYLSDNGVLYSNDMRTIVKYAGNDYTFEIPNTVTHIEKEAFNDCLSLRKIVVGSNVTHIDDGAFMGCYSLADISVDSSNEKYCSIDGVLFSKDKKTLVAYPGNGLPEYTIPDGVTNIQSMAFSDCISLYRVTLPESISCIGDSAFNASYNLKSVILPSTLTEIQNDAFRDCISLISIVIPKNVSNIDSGAFWKSALKTIYYEGTKEEWEALNCRIFTAQLSPVTEYFYSETKPTDTDNYWRYVNNKPKIW